MLRDKSPTEASIPPQRTSSAATMIPGWMPRCFLRRASRVANSSPFQKNAVRVGGRHMTVYMIQGKHGYCTRRYSLVGNIRDALPSASMETTVRYLHHWDSLHQCLGRHTGQKRQCISLQRCHGERSWQYAMAVNMVPAALELTGMAAEVVPRSVPLLP